MEVVISFNSYISNAKLNLQLENLQHNLVPRCILLSMLFFLHYPQNKMLPWSLEKCVYVYVCLCVCLCLSLWMSECVSVCLYACVCVCLCICVFHCVCVCLYLMCLCDMLCVHLSLPLSLPFSSLPPLFLCVSACLPLSLSLSQAGEILTSLYYQSYSIIMQWGMQRSLDILIVFNKL